MKSTILGCLVAVVALTVAPHHVAADVSFQITEAYAGLTGEDGTEDWFEVTNIGTMSGDTGTLFYDDESADPTVNGELTSFILAPGESAIFLIGGNTSDIDDFNAVWSGVARVGTTADGGGLSSAAGDSIFLFDGNTVGASTVDSVSFGAGTFDNVLLTTEGDGTQVYATIQFDEVGVASASVLTDGLSNAFFNDNLNDTTNQVRLAGNPFNSSSIPEPSAAIVVVLGSLGLFRRRR